MRLSFRGTPRGRVPRNPQFQRQRAKPAAVPVAALSLLGLAAFPVSAETVRVFAASSLTEAFLEIAAAHEGARPGTKVELNFAGTQVLRTQIEQGAPADVFASADLSHAEALVRSRLLGPATPFARNALAVVVPAGSARVASLADLGRPGLRLVVAGPAVPVGRYTAAALRRLAAAGSLGPDFEARVHANVVSEETNVRAVLSKVVLGEADAGFVYATDVRAAGDGIRAIRLPTSLQPRVEYAAAVVRGARNPLQARAFLEGLLEGAGARALRRAGFEPPPR